MIVIGIDPGLNGALCLFAPEHGIIELTDMPVFKVAVGGKLRARLDLAGLRDLLDGWRAWGPACVVVEDVGARPGQSGMFTFGYVQGAIEATCMCHGLHVERVTPKVWKKALRVGTAVDEIIQRADWFFQGDAHHWRGPKGGKMHDRAEAALLAKYGSLYLDAILSGGKSKRKHKDAVL